MTKLAGRTGCTALLITLAILLCPNTFADNDWLNKSTQALVLGPTGISDPADLPGYLPAVNSDYLFPQGFSPDGTINVLVTPETPDFGPSIATGTTDLVNAVEADEAAGLLSPSDPLTVVVYSQSTVIASLAEPILVAGGIPSDDLRFIMLGDASDPTGILPTWTALPWVQDIFAVLGWSNLDGATTPNNDYPTEVFGVPQDFWADGATPQDFETHPLQSLWDDIVGNFYHGAYLAPDLNVLDSPSVITDLTTTYTLPDPGDILTTLLAVLLTEVGL
jgi:hypothetical protein